MRLCHLYYKESSPIHVSTLLNSFDYTESIDIDSLNSLDDYDVYVIDIEVVDKELSTKLNSIFKNKNNPLIYFIVPVKYTLMLFQLMFLLGAKGIFTQKQDSDKIVSKINSDFRWHTNSTLVSSLGKSSMNIHSFMCFDNSKLVYVSTKLLDELKCSSLEEFQKNVFTLIDIEELLNLDTTVKQTIKVNGNNKEYVLKSVSISGCDKVVYFEADKTVNRSDISIYSRVSFIEYLKFSIEKENRELSAITVYLSDMDRLKKELNLTELEEYIDDTVYYMESLLPERLMFAQLDKDFYVILFEGIDFTQINTLADEFHENILNDISNKDFKSVVDIFTVCLNSIDFSEALDIFNNIRLKELTYEQKQSDFVKHTSHTQTIISEDSLLEDAFRDQIDIKLLNIYNGLVITTPSKIIHKGKDGVHVSFEQLQGVVMNRDKETVLQSKSFIHDIQANIKSIDLKKKIAHLDNFEFLTTNINSRKYARVTTSSKMPISISLGGSVVSGNIIDISIKSVAASVKYSNKVDDLEQEQVSLVFNIPNYKFDVGYTQLSLGGIVTAIIKDPKSETCKIVCDLDKDSDNEAIISEYVYDRQKELITEVKKMSKLV